MNQRRLLVVLAHPDDETFVGGTMARYSRDGVEITYCCATNGGGGYKPSTLSVQEMEAIRRRELDQSCRELGVRRLVRLEDRHDQSQTLDGLDGGGYDRVADRHREWIADAITDIRPQVVITFGPDGLYGHPNHISVGRVTEEAALASPVAPRVFRLAMLRSQRDAAFAWFDAHPEATAHSLQLAGLPPGADLQVPFVAVPEESVTHRIDVAEVMDRKVAAIRAYRSQGGDGGVLDVLAEFATECYVNVNPVPGAPCHDDLFTQREPSIEGAG